MGPEPKLQGHYDYVLADEEYPEERAKSVHSFLLGLIARRTRRGRLSAQVLCYEKGHRYYLRYF